MQKVKKMKYMVKWSFEAENLDKVIELFQKSLKRSDPENYPKGLSSNYYYHNKFEGFTVVEVENEDQIINYHIYYQPYLNSTFKSIGESVDFIKKYKK